MARWWPRSRRKARSASANQAELPDQDHGPRRGASETAGDKTAAWPIIPLPVRGDPERELRQCFSFRCFSVRSATVCANRAERCQTCPGGANQGATALSESLFGISFRILETKA